MDFSNCSLWLGLSGAARIIVFIIFRHSSLLFTGLNVTSRRLESNEPPVFALLYNYPVLTTELNYWLACRQVNSYGDHSPSIVKFPDIFSDSLRHSYPCSVIHAMRYCFKNINDSSLSNKILKHAIKGPQQAIEQWCSSKREASDEQFPLTRFSPDTSLTFP